MSRPGATEETPCNLCGARDYDVVGTRDRAGRPLRTTMCRACGLVWTNPRPSAVDMDRYYSTEYRADYKGAAAPSLRKIVRGLAGAHDRRCALRSLLRPGAPAGVPGPPRRLLDVGCGAGEFVHLMRRDGFEASGLEPGREYADFAREVLGVPIQTATVDEAAVTPGSLDVVTLFHCLEHVSDPRRVLSTVGGWLRIGGLAIVEVPNVDATVQAPAHRFHYAHLYQFSGATLGALAQAAGLHMVRTYFSADQGNVTCVVRRQSDAERVGAAASLPAAVSTAAARTRAILGSHHWVGHYLSPTPYRRAVDRLRRRLAEDRLLRRLKTTEDVLKWAADREFRDLTTR